VIDETTKAILLLTTYFSGEKNRPFNPLTPIEWGRFAEHLHARNFSPDSLFSHELDKVFEGFADKKISKERVSYLLGRGASLALSLEKWERSGIWILTRGSDEYPGLLKKRLGAKSPPLLFGYGNAKLLNTPSVAVVGSRDVDDNDIKFSRSVAVTAASQGYSIVSGGARGVDEAAMRGAIEAEGTAVGILANSLLRASTSVAYRRHLNEGNLVLVSPFNPEAGFSVGNAMQRNKYIYCMSRAAVVVHSGLSGGTWNGAVENLKQGWVPLFVRKNEDLKAGNTKLVEQGGRWIKYNPSLIDFTIFERDPEKEINNTKSENKSSYDEHKGNVQLDLFVSDK